MREREAESLSNNLDVYAIWAGVYGFVGCFFYAWMKDDQDGQFWKHFGRATLLVIILVATISFGFLWIRNRY